MSTIFLDVFWFACLFFWSRSIATLAITTLLKTGTEGSVDRLMKQISSFMNEIADEFKIVVVKAIRQVSKEAF